MHPYVEPTVQTAEEIDKTQKIIDTDFIDPKTLFAENKKKQQKNRNFNWRCDK